MENELPLLPVADLKQQPLRQVKVRKYFEGIGGIDVLQPMQIVYRPGALWADLQTTCVLSAAGQAQLRGPVNVRSPLPSVCFRSNAVHGTGDVLERRVGAAKQGRHFEAFRSTSAGVACKGVAAAWLAGMAGEARRAARALSSGSASFRATGVTSEERTVESFSGAT